MADPRKKNPIKFKLSLNEEQREAKETILNSKISAIRGSAGSGKSLLAAQVALDLLLNNVVEKIVLTRPAVTAGEEIGFLPGNMSEKLAPYTAAIYDNMYRLYDKMSVEARIAEGKIEVVPLAFIRGRNFMNCCVMVDEAQNLTHTQTELLLGRLCIGSKMIFCGDTHQIDLPKKSLSGFDFMCERLGGIKGFSVITLKTNHRDPIVEEILKVYESAS